MGVFISFGLTEDLKPELVSSDELHRKVVPTLLKVLFKDEKTDSILFAYVPKLEDENVFSEMWALLKVYDAKRKEIYNLINSNRLERYKQ